jgi:Transcription factor Tfb2
MASSSIYSFLHALSPADMTELFTDPWCSLAILQSLTPLGRLFVFRLLAVRMPVLEGFLRNWLLPAAEDALEGALKELEDLQILLRPDEPVSALGPNGVEADAQGDALSLHPSLVASLQRALASEDVAPWRPLTSADDASEGEAAQAPSADSIERASSGRWNAILHYLLGTADAPTLDPKVTELLVSTGAGSR